MIFNLSVLSKISRCVSQSKAKFFIVRKIKTCSFFIRMIQEDTEDRNLHFFIRFSQVVLLHGVSGKDNIGPTGSRTLTVLLELNRRSCC